MKDLSLIGGRYRLIQRLGEGGMAAVYRGWDTESERWVAIKALRPDLARRKRIQRRFANEAKLMASIDHRHVITIFDVGEDEQLPYFIMELAEGGSLYDWVQRYGAMPPRLAVDVVLQACKGISAAHERMVIHRDIKPHNILVTHRGICKVTDFGIAQLQQDEAPSMTRTGSAMGTIGFMAPEQRNDAKSVDERADIYSIGATLYSLLTGENVTDLFLAEHDTTILDGVDEALSAVILKATTYRPADRYADVGQFARALHAARKDLPPIPDDTPSLILPPLDEYNPDQETLTADSFLEIEALLTTGSETPEPAEAPPTLPSEPPRPPPVPEGIKPAPVSHPSDSKPDYLDTQWPFDTPAPAPGSTIELTPEELASVKEYIRKKTATGAPARQRTGGLDVGENLIDLITSTLLSFLRAAKQPAMLLAIPAALFGGIFSVLLTLGASEVRAAAKNADAARSRVYATIERERFVIDELVAMGGSRQGLQAQYNQTQRDVLEPHRYDAATGYLRLLENQLGTVSRLPFPAMAEKTGTVRQRINRIQIAMNAHDEAVAEWEAVSRENRGALAVRMGLAERP